MSEKIKALLATGRISNLPTVWCNCLAAALIIFYYSEKGFLGIITESWSINLTYLTVYSIVISSCLYVGGCFLGDYYDSKFDTKHKPERPIPSGVIRAKTVLISAIVLMMFALLAGVISPAILIDNFLTNQILASLLCLSAAITLYSKYHKKSLYIGLPLIGLCRFCLVIFGAAAAAIIVGFQKANFGETVFLKSTPYFTLPIILFASAVALYTICFASVARTESSDSPITWRNVLRYTMLGLPLLAVITKGDFYGSYHQPATITAVAIYALWLIHSFSYLTRNKGKYVSKCLAGFCLLDACFVAQFGWIWLIICLILFACSLALQKIAPAT